MNQRDVVVAEKRGVVLLMSLVVITIGALIGTTILYFAGAQRHAAEVGLRSAQSRAMAWSGVQGVMAELADQREDLLQGRAVSVTERWVAQGDSPEAGAGAVRWGYRVLRVQASAGSGEDGGQWAACEAEMGKLDVNTATAAMLAKLPGVPSELADAIVEARNARRFMSVPELLRVPGMTAELLFEGGGASGATSEPSPADGAGGQDDPVGAAGDGAGAPREGDTLEAGRARGETTPDEASDASGEATGGTSPEEHPAAGRPLAEWVTVFSFDPEVQLGFGAKASEVRGNQRINLNVEWSDELGDAVARRFDRSVADGVKGLLQSGTTFGTPSSIVKTLRRFQIEPAEWVEVLDAFTTSEEEYRFGQVDLSTASETVLACVPGVTRPAAREIVFRRERLDEERRRTVVWPVLEGILTADEFEQAVDHLTTRCLQWRVIVEGGVLPSSEEGAGEDGVRWEGSREGDGELDLADFARQVDGRGAARVRDRVVLEAVIDVSSQRPRVAMLRDVTHLPLARALAAEARSRAPAASEKEGGARTPSSAGSGAAGERAGEPDGPAERADGAGDGERHGRGAGEPDSTENGAEPDNSESSPRPAPTDSEQGPPGSSTAPGATPKVDRRVGRWTTGGNGGKP